MLKKTDWPRLKKIVLPVGFYVLVFFASWLFEKAYPSGPCTPRPWLPNPVYFTGNQFCCFTWSQHPYSMWP